MRGGGWRGRRERRKEERERERQEKGREGEVSGWRSIPSKRPKPLTKLLPNELKLLPSGGAPLLSASVDSSPTVFFSGGVFFLLGLSAFLLFPIVGFLFLPPFVDC